MSTFQLKKKDIDSLNLVITNFFWGFNGERKKIHLLNRDTIRRVVDKPKTMLNKWVTHNYIKQDSDLNFKHTTVQSPYWKGIVKNADLITNNLRWQVGDSSRINISSRFWAWPCVSGNKTKYVSDLMNESKDG